MSSGMSRRFIWNCLAVLAVVIGIAPAATANEPRRLSPSSPWHLDYSEDSCNLARTFGEGDESITVVMRRYEPTSSFGMTMAGRSFRHARVGNDATLRFGPHEAQQQVSYFTGDLGEFPALIFRGQIRVAPNTAEESAAEAELDLSDYGSFWRESIEPERMAAIEHLFVDARGVSPVILIMDSFDDAFEAFDQCIDELVTHWGIDVERHQTLLRPAWPVGSPGEWIRSSDYPRDMLRRGGQAIINFRLNVDENGGVSGCHIQQRTRPEGFEDLVCRLLTERGEFEPALDADGIPIASYYVSAVQFQIGR